MQSSSRLQKTQPYHEKEDLVQATTQAMVVKGQGEAPTPHVEFWMHHCLQNLSTTHHKLRHGTCLADWQLSRMEENKFIWAILIKNQL